MTQEENSSENDTTEGLEVFGIPLQELTLDVLQNMMAEQDDPMFKSILEMIVNETDNDLRDLILKYFAYMQEAPATAKTILDMLETKAPTNEGLWFIKSLPLGSDDVVSDPDEFLPLYLTAEGIGCTKAFTNLFSMAIDLGVKKADELWQDTKDLETLFLKFTDLCEPQELRVLFFTTFLKLRTGNQEHAEAFFDFLNERWSDSAPGIYLAAIKKYGDVGQNISDHDKPGFTKQLKAARAKASGDQQMVVERMISIMSD